MRKAPSTANSERKTMSLRPDQHAKLAQVSGQLDISIISVIDILCKHYATVSNLKPYAEPYREVKRLPSMDKMADSLRQLSPEQLKQLLAEVGAKK